MAAHDVIVLNSHGVGQYAYCDHMPTWGETLAVKNWHVAEDGGKGSNVSGALGRLGLDCAYVGKVGNDPWGDRYGGWASAPLVRTYEVQVAVVYLEFRDARDGQVVWTGSAETDASGERSDRNQALREATAEALGEYPPR